MAQAIVWQVPNLAQAVVDSSAGTLTYQTYDSSTSNWVTQWTLNLGTGDVTATSLFTASGGFTSTPTGSVAPPASPLVSGTVYQNTTGRYMNVYQPAYATTSGTAGTVAVSLGSSSSPGTIYTDQIGGGTSSTAPRMVYLKVPPDWYYSVTTSGTTLLTATMIAE